MIYSMSEFDNLDPERFIKDFTEDVEIASAIAGAYDDTEHQPQPFAERVIEVIELEDIFDL